MTMICKLCRHKVEECDCTCGPTPVNDPPPKEPDKPPPIRVDSPREGTIRFYC